MKLITGHPVWRLRKSGALRPLPQMLSWLTQGQVLSWFSRVLSPDLRFADVLPVSTLMIPAVVHRSCAYVGNFTGDIQYFYIHGLWGMILSFGVRRYRTVFESSFETPRHQRRHIYWRSVYEFVVCYSPTYFLAYALSSPSPVDEIVYEGAEAAD
jgi:hypothetical protein